MRKQNITGWKKYALKKKNQKEVSIAILILDKEKWKAKKHY